MFNFFNEIAEIAKKSKDIALDNFNIINLSGKIVYVEGHMGLITLSKETVSFKIKKGVVMIQGKDLILAELSENTIKICGEIKKMEQV